MDMNQKMGTLERILISAEKEFLEKGYQGAGLRKIASDADVTTGAFYRHFKGKKELFSALVDDVYTHIIQMYRDTLIEFFRLAPEDQAVNMSQYTRRAVDAMTDYIYEHRSKMKLILSCSEGTDYADLADVLASMDETATYDFMDERQSAGIGINPVQGDLQSLLTKGMFTTFLGLIEKDLPREEMRECSNALLDFYEAGWWKIMGL